MQRGAQFVNGILTKAVEFKRQISQEQADLYVCSFVYSREMFDPNRMTASGAQGTEITLCLFPGLGRIVNSEGDRTAVVKARVLFKRS
jgi:hypothetical protein